MEIRYLTYEDINDWNRLMRYAFDTNRNTFDDLKIEENTEAIFSRTMGLFQDGILKASIINLDYKLFLRGVWFKTAAIAGVASRPEYRRQSLITKLFSRLFQDINNQGQSLSALYPFNYPFYEKYGYQVVVDQEIITVPIRVIKLKQGSDIKMKMVEDAEFLELASQVYERAIQRHNLVYQRTKFMWNRILKDRKGFKYLCFGENSNPEGYAILEFENFDWNVDSEDKSVIHLNEFFWDSPEAKQAIFNLLKNHDSQRKYVKIKTFDRNSIPYIHDIKSIKREIFPGMMLRIMNVQNVLEHINYPAEVQGSFTFSVLDNQCPWNKGIFKVEINDGRAHVNILQDKSIDQDFICDIGSLTQLVSGYLSYNKLVESAKISKSSDNLLPQNAFPEQLNIPRDFF